MRTWSRSRARSPKRSGPSNNARESGSRTRRGCCRRSAPTATGKSTCAIGGPPPAAALGARVRHREQSGRAIEFKPHRFRHTIATELFNRGLSKAGIQRFLSHESGAMTDVYAHMLDQTLKQEWLATRERINAAGERVALTTPVIDDDAAWLKHQLARAKQTLPDGECGLPIQQCCPHPNACHSCPHFLTDERYRPVLEEQLERAEQRVATPSAPGTIAWRRSTAPTCSISGGSSPGWTGWPGERLSPKRWPPISASAAPSVAAR